MALLTESYLAERAKKASGYVHEQNIRNFSQQALASSTKAASAQDSYDIFLSHAFEDAILIKGLRDELEDRGFKVYVDWIDDAQLDRKQVSKETAAILRQRMRQSRSLLFATSKAAQSSVWMPWELGYMDEYTSSRVAIAPIVPDNEASKEFKGQEYLGLYPYLDKTGENLYIHESAGKWAGFSQWLAGADPEKH
jgi:hypothetical protein